MILVTTHGIESCEAAKSMTEEYTDAPNLKEASIINVLQSLKLSPVMHQLWTSYAKKAPVLLRMEHSLRFTNY